MKPHLLLVEDDSLLGASLADNFQMEGFNVDWLQDGNEALSIALKQMHDVIILDLMLPKRNGIEILKVIREKSKIPVLILSARSSTSDRISGLEAGADDYLAKPFHFKELLLRVNALLKRRSQSHEIPDSVRIGKAHFDLKSLTVEFEGKKDHLTEKELLLLKLLFVNSNKIVSRHKILDQVWGLTRSPSTRTIDNMIVKLRKWVESDPSNPNLIRSHRGIGYSLKNEEI